MASSFRSVFFDNRATGEEAPSDRPVTMTRDEALACFDRAMTTYKSFLGVTFDDARCVQFYAEGEILVDVPEPERKGSHQRHVGWDEARAILSTLFDEGASPSTIPGLTFVAW